VKRNMKALWPFMWQVSGVTGDKITCDGYQCVPMSSYNYLDFIRDTRVNDNAIATAQLWAAGNHGPRMLGGNTTILRDLEKTISTFFGRDDALVCSSGFLACMSGLCVAGTHGDVFFADHRIHASLRAGLKLSGAKYFFFRHNDYDDCESLMKKHRRKYKKAFILIESVYSMDGDVGNLPMAYSVAQAYEARIVVDEAHGLGVLGKTGRGLEEHFGMPGAVFLIMGTFSKSISSVGGFITGDKDVIEYSDFHSPGSVFSAPMPAYCAGAAIKAFELIDQEPWRVKLAQDNSKYLRKCLSTGLNCWPKDYPEEYKYEIEGDEVTTVIPVVFPDDTDRTMKVASRLKTMGFMVSAVSFPACPLRRPRFRITATTAYDNALIEDFTRKLVQATVENPLSETAKQLRRLL